VTKPAQCRLHYDRGMCVKRCLEWVSSFNTHLSHSRQLFNIHLPSLVMSAKLHSVTYSLTVCNPVASSVAPESSVAPIESFRNYLIQHRHIEVDGIVQKQGVDRTLNTKVQFTQPQ